MADKRISELTLHTTPELSDILPIVNNDETKRVTYGTIYYGIRDGLITENNTSSYATTGSNIFNGSQNVIGSVTSSKVLTDAVRFNTSAGVSVGVGELVWNNSDGTLDLGMKGGNVVQQIGQATYYEVRNDTVSVIPKGTAVYADGVTASGGRITAAPYTADGSIREVRFLGLAAESISTGINGFVTHFGYVRGLDTRGNVVSSIAVGDETWAVGDILYVHPTVAGKLTNVAPEHEIIVAIIINRHQSAGVIFVRPSSGGHLEDLHDITINTGSLTNGQVLAYNSTSGLWENTNQINTSSFATTGSNVFNDNQTISGSITATSFIGNGANLSNVTTQVTGSWTLPIGASTQSIEVVPGGSYSMWVSGNIPNGIISWNATVTTSNTNVPAIGSQFGWYYVDGNALVLTSIPDQIVGTNGSIISSPSSYAPNTSNVFKFGITNNSGATQTIYWGYNIL